MTKDLCYCTTEECPVKEDCKRSTFNLTKEESNQNLWIFTESPGAYRRVKGKLSWICPKQLKKEQ
jgi:hypothetical protein